jgi:hypothetical protein
LAENKTNLSDGQQVIWAGQRLYPESPLFNAAAYDVLSCALEPEHLSRAWATLVRNSDALRTIFTESQGVPRWRVVANVPWSLHVFDLSGEADPDASLAVWAQERCQMSLDLESCVFDISLVRMAPRRCAVYMNVHHIVCDQWSNAIICRLLGHYYQLSVSNRLNEATPGLPFAKYLEGKSAQMTSWSSASLAGNRTIESSAPLSFYGRPAKIRTTDVVRVPYVIQARRLQRLSEALTGVPATKEGLLSALVVALLYRITGSSTVTFGAPYHNRAGWEETIGLFMSILPITVQIVADDTLSTLHRTIATARLRARLSASRGGEWPAGNPKLRRNYDVEFNYMANVVPGLLPGISVRQKWLHPGYGLDPLAIQMFRQEGDADQHCVFDFHCDIFDENCRRQAIADFEDVMNALIEQPNATVSQLLSQPCQ